MQFFIKRGAIIFTCLFAGLLITQTILIFSNYSSVNNHLATGTTVSPEQKDQSEVSTSTDLEATAQHRHEQRIRDDRPSNFIAYVRTSAAVFLGQKYHTKP